MKFNSTSIQTYGEPKKYAKICKMSQEQIDPENQRMGPSLNKNAPSWSNGYLSKNPALLLFAFTLAWQQIVLANSLLKAISGQT